MSTDPNILEATEFERRLLDAAGNERPSPELSARMASALGLPLGPSVTPLPAAKLAGLLPSGVIAAALGGAFGLWLLLRPSAEPSPKPAAVPANPAPPRAAAATHGPHVGVLSAAPGAEAAPVIPTPTPAPAPAAANPLANAPTSAGKGSGDSAPGSDLREEIRAIDAVRGALAARNPAQALTLLRRYSSTYPNGTFGQEATVLRVQALEQSGQHAKAQALSRDFRGKHPNSPLSERLSRLSGTSSSSN